MPRGIPNPKPEDADIIELAETSGSDIIESPVAPIESVISTADNPCWNCHHQLYGDKCDNCGFDKSMLYNLELEEKKANERKEKANAKSSTT
jgi:hypothetical protein